MESILTPSELEALLQPTGGVPTATSSAKPIDLVARDHQAFGLLPELQKAADHSAKLIAQLCTHQLQLNCKGSADPVEVVPGPRLPDLIPQPRFVYAVQVNEAPVAGVICIETLLGSIFVARQFGGRPSLDSITTSPTATERRTVIRLASQILATLTAILRPAMPLQAGAVLEVPSPLDQISRAQAVLLIVIRLALADQRSMVTIAIDTSAPGLKLVVHPTKYVAGGDDQLRSNLRHVPVTATAQLGQVTLTLRKLMSMTPGELLTLDTTVDAEIPLALSGITKFLGRPVLQRGNVGLEIKRIIKE
jgi:flagellar motor switch protein FliM